MAKKLESASNLKRNAKLLQAQTDIKHQAILKVAERSAKERKLELFESVFSCLWDDWSLHGRSVIANVREENPISYLKIITSLLPKESAVAFTVDYDPAAELERLREQSRRADAIINGTAERIE